MGNQIDNIRSDNRQSEMELMMQRMAFDEERRERFQANREEDERRRQMIDPFLMASMERNRIRDMEEREFMQAFIDLTGNRDTTNRLPVFF